MPALTAPCAQVAVAGGAIGVVGPLPGGDRFGRGCDGISEAGGWLAGDVLTGAGAGTFAADVGRRRGLAPTTFRIMPSLLVRM